MPDSELQKSLGQEKGPRDGVRYAQLITVFPDVVVESKKKRVTSVVGNFVIPRFPRSPLGGNAASSGTP
jgi:hypothetical protein